MAAAQLQNKQERLGRHLQGSAQDRKRRRRRLKQALKGRRDDRRQRHACIAASPLRARTRMRDKASWLHGCLQARAAAALASGKARTGCSRKASASIPVARGPENLRARDARRAVAAGGAAHSGNSKKLVGLRGT
jgi:hypothetical protein